MKYYYEERLNAVQKCLAGKSPRLVAKELGMDCNELYVWMARYKQDGLSGLSKLPKKNANYAEKCKIVCESAEKGVSLSQICAKYHVSRGSVKRWIRIYRQGGYEALRSNKPKKKLKKMGRPKKKEPQTELERLRYEVEYLRAENALLKKVRALMDEKEKRLHETGRKPSKH